MIVCASICGVLSQDYCDPDLCPGLKAGQKHIGCNNTGEFADSCPEDRVMVQITSFEIQDILNVHNNLRSLVAGGDAKGFDGAIKMNKLVRLPRKNILPQIFNQEKFLLIFQISVIDLGPRTS